MKSEPGTVHIWNDAIIISIKSWSVWAMFPLSLYCVLHETRNSWHIWFCVYFFLVSIRYLSDVTFRNGFIVCKKKKCSLLHYVHPRLGYIRNRPQIGLSPYNKSLPCSIIVLYHKTSNSFCIYRSIISGLTSLSVDKKRSLDQTLLLYLQKSLK